MSDEIVEVKRPWWAEDIRGAWRWATVQIGVLVALAPELYNAVQVLSTYLTPTQMLHIMSIIGVINVIYQLKNKTPK